MNINITGRHMKLTPAIHEYIERKVTRMQHYFDHLISAQVIVSVDKYRHTATLDVHGAGKTFRAKAEEQDLYAALDLAADKLQQQLHKYKEKVKVHRPAKRKFRKLNLKEHLGAFISDAPKEFATDHYEGLTSIKSARLLPMRVKEAMVLMEKEHGRFWLFTHEETGRVCVLYRKNGEGYGLLEMVS